VDRVQRSKMVRDRALSEPGARLDLLARESMWDALGERVTDLLPVLVGLLLGRVGHDQKSAFLTSEPDVSHASRSGGLRKSKHDRSARFCLYQAHVARAVAADDPRAGRDVEVAIA